MAFTTCESLKPYVGRDLYDLALSRGITVMKDGKQQKGWKGNTLELLAGLRTDIRQAPDGIDFELKSVATLCINGRLEPKETMAITMINAAQVKETPFEGSHCWAKLQSMVLCCVMWHGPNVSRSELLKVIPIETHVMKQFRNQIEADYELVRRKILDTGFSSLSGRDGVLIQPRTLSAGHGSISRAFYARKELLRSLFQLG